MTNLHLTSRSNLLSNIFKWEFVKIVEVKVLILTRYVKPNDSMTE